jgi:hypothetical protein
MNPQAAPAAPTPAPIHDIVGPVSFFPYPIWMVVVAALALLVIIGLLAWFIATRRKPVKHLTPGEQALAELASLREQVETSDPYPFSIAVSDVLRIYLRDAHNMSATTQTSREFLETAGTLRFFNEDERVALAAFLEKADLIKFARMHATPVDCAGLLDKAEQLVKSRALQPEAVK